MMDFQIIVKGHQYATNNEHLGVFELVNGAYIQHRGTGQTPKFKSKQHFRRYIYRMLKDNA